MHKDDVVTLILEIWEIDILLKFDGYDVCQWNDEKFEQIYQVLTTNNAKAHLRKYS